MRWSNLPTNARRGEGRLLDLSKRDHAVADEPEIDGRFRRLEMQVLVREAGGG